MLILGLWSCHRMLALRGVPNGIGCWFGQANASSLLQTVFTFMRWLYEGATGGALGIFPSVGICSSSPLSETKIHSERRSALSSLNQTAISHHAMMQYCFSAKNFSYYLCFFMEKLRSSFRPNPVLSTRTRHLLNENVNAWFLEKSDVSFSFGELCR